jgi:phosphatidylethanolamine-binding protein (PEBP) family uncharacterized protein
MQQMLFLQRTTGVLLLTMLFSIASASAQTLNVFSKGAATSLQTSDIRSIKFDKKMTIQSATSTTISSVEFSAVDSLNVSSGTFTLLSSTFTNNGELPKEYTCNGASASPPVNWINPPVATKSFVLIMHTIVGPTPDKPTQNDTHTYIILYNIPPTITSIPKSVSGIGLFGINTVNGKTSYTPPCSQGPGAKLYTLTVYALSAEPVLTVAQTAVTRDIMLAAISKTTLAQAAINVTYTR